MEVLEIKGKVFSVKEEFWFITSEEGKRIKIKNPFPCPARKGDLFYGFGIKLEVPEEEKDKTLYDILEVKKDSSPEEIKISYRKLAIKFHPDKNHMMDTTEIFQEISNAYDELGDPEKRRRYDYTLKQKEGREKKKKKEEDVWKLVEPPMLKISLGEENIKDLLKRALRCGKGKIEEIFFHLKVKVKKYRHETIQEYIDQTIAYYLRAPTEKVLEEIFPGQPKEGILRFFRWWNDIMKRRFELLGLPREFVREIKRPPSELYDLLMDSPLKVPEIPLENAKEIMTRMNKPWNPTEEKCAIMLRYVYKELENGNVFIPYAQLHHKFQLSADEFYLLEKFGVYGERETGRVFYKDAYLTNKELVDFLYKRMTGNVPKREVDMEKMNPNLTDTQKMGLFCALQLPLTIITGRAGCGKSTLIGEIYKQEPNIALMSFTGKAVSRLSEITRTKDPATIHKIIANLDISEETRHIIIDEATMAYTDLILRLVVAFPYPTYNFRITLVGDPHQLPPITWGAFFEELINTKKVPIITLTQNMRVKVEENEEDGILYNCNKLLQHVEDIKTTCFVKPFSFKVTPNFQLRNGTAKDAVNILVSRKNMGLPIDDTVILTPYKDCVKELNELCNAEFKKGKKSVVDSRGNEWFIGSPICNRVNNYHKNIMNGDRGKIHDIEKDKLVVKINDEFVLFSTKVVSTFMGQNFLYESNKDLNEDEFTNTGTLMLDYASTVHSAQGSEWNHVIIYIPKGRPANFTFIYYRLVYTMISRAKKKVWIVGDIEALNVVAVSSKKKKNDNFGELFTQKFISTSTE